MIFFPLGPSLIIHCSIFSGLVQGKVRWDGACQPPSPHFNSVSTLFPVSACSHNKTQSHPPVTIQWFASAWASPPQGFLNDFFGFASSRNVLRSSPCKWSPSSPRFYLCVHVLRFIILFLWNNFKFGFRSCQIYIKINVFHTTFWNLCFI